MLYQDADDKVLEVGTGSGYGAAVLAVLGAEVHTIERHQELADIATERLAREGFDNVRVLAGDGTLGWPIEAPFDVIGGTVEVREKDIGELKDGAIDEDALAAEVDSYQGKVWLYDDDAGTTDRYAVAWFKNGEPIFSGITSPTIRPSSCDSR